MNTYETTFANAFVAQYYEWIEVTSGKFKYNFNIYICIDPVFYMQNMLEYLKFPTNSNNFKFL